MNTNEFDKAKIFSFSESVDYFRRRYHQQNTVLRKQTGNISLFSFAKGEALSEHTAPFDAMIRLLMGGER